MSISYNSLSIRLFTLALGVTSYSALANGSTTLSELYLDTLNNNPQLKQAELFVSESEASKQQVKGNYLPQVDLGVAFGGLRNDYTTLTETDSHGASANLSLRQNLFNQKLNKISGLSESQIALAKTSYQATLDGVTFNVAVGYFSALKAQESLKQQKATLSAIEEQLRQTKNRFENGLVPENDVIDAQAQYDLTLVSVIMAENDVDKALDGLYELSGKQYNSVTPLNVDLYDAVLPTPENYVSWEEQAQRFNPVMNVQADLVALSKEQIDLANAGHMPTLGLVAEYRYGFAQSSRINSQGQDKGSFNTIDNNSTLFAGIAMQLPVYRGGSTESQVDKATLQYQQAVQNQEQTWRSVSRQIRNAEKDLKALLSAKKAYLQAVKSAEASLVATEQGFELGSRTIVDVLNGTRQVYKAELDLTYAQIDFVLAALQLKFLGGDLTAEDIGSLNMGLAHQYNF